MAWQDKYSGLKWADLLNQAKADHAAQWERGIDPLTGGSTTINGQRAQIYLSPDDSDTGPADWWNNAGMNLYDPDYVGVDGTKDWRLALNEGPNGSVNVTPQKTEDVNKAFLKDLATFVAIAASMGTAGAALGGAGATGAGATGASLGSGVSLGGGGATGITGAVGSGGLASGVGSGLGFTAANAAPGALGSLGSGFFGAEGLTGLGAVAGGAAAGGGGGSMLSTLGGKAADLLGSKAGAALLGGALGGIGGSSNAGDQTATTRQEIDPRMAAILYGPNGNDGFINNSILGQLNTPQKPGMSGFGSAVDSYLGSSGANQMQDLFSGANSLQNSNIGAPMMSAAQVNAPGQNNTNLVPAYQDMIYGQPGNNPFLTGAIQKGINQSSNAFSDMLNQSTRNLTENILPSIRSGARVSGNYGGNREALAEGKALTGFSDAMGQALQRFGQGNTDAAVSAQAGAFDADRNRALSALSGLSGNQYTTAIQNAGFQQQANQNNLQSQLSTNQLNSSNKIAGLNAGSGLLGQAYGMGQDNDAYGLNKVGKVSSLLSPYTGLGGSSTQTQPLYENKMNNILGGVSTGLGLYNMFNK